MIGDLEPIAPIEARTHGLLEAPRLTPEGDVLYTDVTLGGAWRLRGNEVSELVPKRRGIGGMVLHSDGGVVLTGRTLLHVTADGDQRTLFTSEDVAGLNDITTDSEGHVLAGALRYRPFAGDPPVPGQLLRIGVDGHTEVLSEDVIWPNGIGVAAEGARIYISDYANKQVLIVPGGGGTSDVFCRSPRGSADGLALDVEGGVWIALAEGSGIARFTEDGELDQLIDVPLGLVSSLSFGGPDGRDVLITGADDLMSGGHLWRGRSEIAGAEVVPARI